MNTKDIIEIIEQNNLYPNKKLGQNFLCNNGIIDKIVEVSNVNSGDHILEIGPGLGGLTEKLIAKANLVTIVEIDSGLVKLLKEKFLDVKNINIIHADFLEDGINGNYTKSISNLPYYCSSEMLFELGLKYKINEIYVMLQKEMAERIFSRPGMKTYGALTISLGFYYEPKILFNIDKKSFYPQPDVASSFLYLKRRAAIDLNAEELKLFHNIIKSAFWGRRKTLKKGLTDSPHLNLSRDIIISAFNELNLSENIRGENLSINEFKDIAKSIYSKIK
jgi:16S rRNA (adenine1518-N6/adenine1519-N6)-dimethyltransferase